MLRTRILAGSVARRLAPSLRCAQLLSTLETKTGDAKPTASNKSKFLERVLDPAFANYTAILDPITKQSYTFKQLDFLSNKVAEELIEHKYHQKTAALGSFNYSPSSFVISMLATWKIGKVFVPLSVTHSINELSHFIQDSNIGGILCYNQHDITQEKLDSLPAKILEVQPILSPATSKDKPLSEKLQSPSIRLPSASDALVLYTSGTTGRPKGVVHTHDGIEHMIKSLVEAWKYNSNDKILHFLPLYHMHGLVNKLLCVLWAGGTVEFLTSAKAKVIWPRLAAESQALQQKPLTLFMGVPTVYAKMLEYAKTMDPSEKENGIKTMKSLRLMVCGSAALPDIIMDEWKNMTGQTLLERYGMTELGMALSNPLEGERRKGSVGFPMPYITVRIVDDNGAVVKAPNTPGELQVMGKTVFKRYLNKPEATRDAFDGNWFKTGDIAEVSADGYYKLLGRNSTDIIKSAGYKISALEIERELLSHPKVLEVAVLGVPDLELGEKIIAIICLRPEHNSNDTSSIHQEMDDHLADRLAKYKQPRKYFLADHLPRNHLGKVNKKTLLQELHINADKIERQ